MPPPTTGSLVQGNVVRNMQSDGIGLFDNFFADVKVNTVVVPANDNFAGIDTQYFFGQPGAIEVSGNSVTVGQDSFGIYAKQLFNASFRREFSC